MAIVLPPVLPRVLPFRTLPLIALLLLPVPAPAQDLDPVRVEKRVGKLEAEMRAVQRKVFPGGDPRFFEPEIAAPAAAPAAAVGNPASAPLVDLTARVGELERQLREMTGAVEANQFKLRQLEEAQAKLRADVEFRLTALEGGGAAAAAAVPAATKPGAKPTSPAPKPAATPATADAAWKAAYAHALDTDWPATETAMTDFIAAYPKSSRIPQAQYWLGKSFAARDQHAQAAKSFLELYQTAPLSSRGPDSLLGLATAMNGLKKPKDACRVLGELDSVYGEKLTPAQQTEAKAQRTRAKCPA
jgi:TolA-binding protein